MNKLNEMNIAELSEEEVKKLRSLEQDINKVHQGDEIYLIALKK